MAKSIGCIKNLRAEGEFMNLAFCFLQLMSGEFEALSTASSLQEVGMVGRGVGLVMDAEEFFELEMDSWGDSVNILKLFGVSIRA